MIKFKCPNCGKDVSAGDEHAGKKGRCPACKELFTIPAAKPAPAPAAEEDEAPPTNKRPADYDPDDPEAAKELIRRTGVKVVKLQPDEDEDEAIAEAPRKKRPARDEDDEYDDRPARRKRGRDEEDEEDDEPRGRKKRDRDEEEDDEEDRPRRRRKKRRGEYADCPECGARGDATLVSFTWWGGLLGPRLFTHVRCNRCGTCYNGKTGEYNTTRIAIYVGVSSVIAIALLILLIVVQA